MGRAVKQNLGLFHSFLGFGLSYPLPYWGFRGGFEAHDRLARGVRQPVMRIEYEGFFFSFLGVLTARRLCLNFSGLRRGSLICEINVCLSLFLSFCALRSEADWPGRALPCCHSARLTAG
jgi:hypothetical protein